ncbi:hypothetical protein FRC19_006276 [Serendipita sp. 401]|nr:hypothetical protein FRC19_006276 [Serendipita sp. 401]KAG9045895.1 hypothetical protein FS842_001044 [Serendipita sp. 407]
MSTRLSPQEQNKQIDAILATINTKVAVKRRNCTEGDSVRNKKRVRRDREQTEESEASSSSSSRMEGPSRLVLDNRFSVTKKISASPIASSSDERGGTSMPKKLPTSDAPPVPVPVPMPKRRGRPRKDGKDKPDASSNGAQNAPHSCSACKERRGVCGGPLQAGDSCLPCKNGHLACSFVTSVLQQKRSESLIKTNPQEKKGKEKRKNAAKAVRPPPTPTRRVSIRIPDRGEVGPQVTDDVRGHATDTEEDTEEEMDWEVELAALRKEIVHDITAKVNTELKEMRAAIAQCRRAITTVSTRENKRHDVWERRWTGLDPKLARIGTETTRNLEIASGTLVMLDSLISELQ